MSLRYTSMKVGDTLGLLEYQIVDDKMTLPLIDATIIFRMVRISDGEVAVDDKAGVLVDGADGIPGSTGVVGYQRVVADVIVGLMNCEFTITTESGFFHLSPNIQLLIEPVL